MPRPFESLEAMLDAIAALHAGFWLDPALEDEALGLCTPANLFTHLSAERAERLAAEHSGFPAWVLEYLQQGWMYVSDLLDDDVVELLHALLRDPSPLCVALEDFEWTLVHGDLWTANLGLRWQGTTPTLIALDMARCVRTAPAADLAWYLAFNPLELPVSNEEAIATYRRHLERRLGRRFDDADWTRQMDLCLLGALMMIAPVKAKVVVDGEGSERSASERRELAWWSERACAGARHLG